MASAATTPESDRAVLDVFARLAEPVDGMGQRLKKLSTRLHEQIQAVRDLGPVNGSFDEQEKIERELCAIASDLRRWWDHEYAKRLDRQNSTGMGNR